jgi:outer membrane receptor for ferrienterochelin and colicin
MNLSVNEKLVSREITPKGTLSGSTKQQQWQVLNWHEIRLAKLTTFLTDYENKIKTMATEIVNLKTEIESLKKLNARN